MKEGTQLANQIVPLPLINLDFEILKVGPVTDHCKCRKHECDRSSNQQPILHRACPTETTCSQLLVQLIAWQQRPCMSQTPPTSLFVDSQL